MIPLDQIEALESPKNTQNANDDRLSVSFYVYVELPEPGNGNRQKKIAKKLRRCTRRYTVAAGRARDKALEQAAEIACTYLYRLRDEGVRFNRVFVSTLGDTQAARRDPDSLDYYVM
jgi:hypothetical protein